MPTRSARFYSLALIVGDFLILLLAFSLAYIVRAKFDPRPVRITEISGTEFIESTLLIIPLWLLAFTFLGLYSSQIYNKRLAEWGRLLIGSILGILIILGYSYVIDEPVFPARLTAVYALIGSFVLLVWGREILRLVRTLMFRFGRGISHVLIIGDSPATKDIAIQLSDTARSGYKVAAIAGPNAAIPKGFKGVQYRSLDQALTNLHTYHITTIIQTDLYDSQERNKKILAAAQQRHISYSFIPGEDEFYTGKNSIDVFLGYPIISVHQTPLTGWGIIVKRVFDIVVTSLLLLFLSPLLLIIIILQKILNPGPVFYFSKRLTRFSTPFGLIKFRSMRPEYGSRDAADEFAAMGRDDLAAEYNAHRKVKNDPRITSFGKLLRASSIDELPQLFNVLKGDLSLVGPRPILPAELPFYKGKAALLHSVKSGATGLWQVSGRNDLPFEKRVELELYYAQNWSFWLDIKILLKTLPALLNKGGR